MSTKPDRPEPRPQDSGNSVPPIGGDAEEIVSFTADELREIEAGGFTLGDAIRAIGA